MTGAGVCEHVRPQTHKERWRAYAWQTAFTLFTQDIKREWWLLFEIIKGVALPLSLVWPQDVETRER